MKYLSKIVMALIVSVALIGCAQPPVDETGGFKSSENGKLIKIYSDSNLVIYKHKITPSYGWDFIYVNKNGGVVISRN